MTVSWQRLHVFFSLLIPDMSHEEKQLLDEALIKTYARKGITHKNESLIDPKHPDQYKEMPILGDLVEIQEPTVIANPGVLVGLNSLLDRCNSVFLPNGEVIKRHSDTVIVVTTNNDYAGCRPMNQSVISRMNLVIDMDEPDEDTMIERVLAITGCSDKKSVRTMAQIVRSIAQYCQDNLITDGCCGIRELIAWVQSFMVCGDLMEAAHYTILSSVTADTESRLEIEGSCLETVIAA